MGLMTNKLHDPQKWLEEVNREWDIFQHDYLFDMEDKIYVSQIKNKEIKGLCLREKEVYFNDNLAGDIKREYQIQNKDTINAVSDELKRHLPKIFNTNVSSISLYDNITNNIDLWINYQRKNEFNPLHSHAGQLSFVFYASIPEEIRNEHKESHSVNTQARGLIQFLSNRTSGKMLFNPREDDLLIFKSDHMHQVYPFYSDNTRISIAGNIHGWD
jgi:hypothetical protein